MSGRLTCIIAASEPAGISPPWTLEVLDCGFRISSFVRWKVSSVPDMIVSVQ